MLPRLLLLQGNSGHHARLHTTSTRKSMITPELSVWRSPSLNTSVGKSVHFLLSGLFCCLGFSICFLLFGRRRVLIFAVWAGRGPRPNSKN